MARSAKSKKRSQRQSEVRTPILVPVGLAFVFGVIVGAIMFRSESGPSQSVPVSSAIPPAPLSAGSTEPSPELVKRIGQLHRYLEENPDDLNTHIALGNVLFDVGQYQDAIGHYDRALEMQPDNVNVIVDRGICFRRIGQPERAVEEFKRAIQLDPNHVTAHYNLGLVAKSDLNDNVTAKAAWTRYLQLAPNAPNAEAIRSALQQM